MRPSRVLRKLRAGEAICSFKVNFGDARVSELAAMHGFDCIWTCREHTATDWNVIEQQVWATKTQDVDLMVRVERGSPSDYVRPLELDAAGILVPHIMSAEDAAQVARMTRFQPIGLRPVDSGNADGAYCNIPFTEYLEQANRERFVLVQIEDPEPLDELDAIAATEGIDGLLFGPGDFTHALGIPGQFDAPEVQDARKRVADACIRNGKIAATVGSPETAPALLDLGYRFINIGSDVVSVSRACSQAVDSFSTSADAAKA
jgi:4-hydroxy-2-oxoheptanedioate aldolase